MYNGGKGDSHDVEEVLEDAKIYIYVSICGVCKCNQTKATKQTKPQHD